MYVHVHVYVRHFLCVLVFISNIRIVRERTLCINTRIFTLNFSYFFRGIYNKYTRHQVRITIITLYLNEHLDWTYCKHSMKFFTKCISINFSDTTQIIWDEVFGSGLMVKFYFKLVIEGHINASCRVIYRCI